MNLELYLAGCSDPGRERDHNEDSLLVQRLEDGSHLLVVCDGMGGHEAGDVASQAAVTAIYRSILSPSDQPSYQRIYQALQAANEAVLRQAEEIGAPAMGTTAVVCHIQGDRCWVGWVGDSRFYRFRQGAILDQTEDHTRVRKMVQMQILDPAEARVHPDAHILTQALGGGAAAQQSFRPEVWREPVLLQRGDVILLCSDGLYDMIEDPQLYGVVEGFGYEEAVDRLVRTANDLGGPDNISVILGVFGREDVPRVPRGGRAWADFAAGGEDRNRGPVGFDPARPGGVQRKVRAEVWAAEDPRDGSPAQNMEGGVDRVRSSWPPPPGGRPSAAPPASSSPASPAKLDAAPAVQASLRWVLTAFGGGLMIGLLLGFVVWGWAGRGRGDVDTPPAARRGVTQPLDVPPLPSARVVPAGPTSPPAPSPAPSVSLPQRGDVREPAPSQPVTPSPTKKTSKSMGTTDSKKK